MESGLRIKIENQKNQDCKRIKLEEDLNLQDESNNQLSNAEFVARDYQSEILERAIKENVIACLGTGTGKTYIAVMLIKHFFHETRSDYNGSGKRTVFLVPTVPLVRQQARVIQRHLPDAKIGEHYGENTVELGNKEWWQREVEDKNILVMVAEEFRLLVHHAFISVSKINLIVIDECHRAVKNHPYREAMKCFDCCGPQNRPRIFGLTAPLVNAKCRPYQLDQHIKSLERALQSVVVTAENSLSVKNYGTDPSEFLVVHQAYCNNNEIFKQVIRFLEITVSGFTKDINETLDDDVIFYTKPRKCISSVLQIATTLGPWCTLYSTRVILEEMKRIPRNEENASIHEKVEASLKVVYKLCVQICKDDTSAITFSSPKLKKLLQILKKVHDYFNAHKFERTNPGDSVLCGIIFVRQRLCAYVLHCWLDSVSKVNNDFAFLKTNFVVGHGQQQQQNMAVPIAKLSSINHKKQEKVIKDFRARKYNFLVSTSVLEEGIDVPKCNIVIRFDLPDDFRAYIQSKGRARANNAKYILMVSEKENEKFLDSLADFRENEKLLYKLCHERQQPTEEEIFEAYNCDELLPPYMPVKKDGAPRITMSSSIALINRYCTTLPCDKSSRLMPRWKTDTVSLGTTCTLSLPVNSAIKESVTSPPMPNKRLAKMAAALKMCEKLHEVGELDENLLPVGCKVDKYISDLLGNEVVDCNNTMKSHSYEKAVPEVLKHNLLQGNIHYLLYAIELDFAPNSDLTKLKEYEKLEGRHGFAILTTSPLPQLCTFPIFSQKAGLQINVNIDFACSEIYLDGAMLNDVFCFHRYLFSDVIQVDRGRLTFDPDHSNFKILIAPIIRDDISMECHVDWEVISAVCDHCSVSKDQLIERSRILQNPDKYKGALIYPWHYITAKEKIYFYVEKIEHEMTPRNPFPEPEYSSYTDYFHKKYDVQIMWTDHFLLYVNPISTSLLSEKSRYVDQYGKPLMKQSKQAKRKPIILPPELCIISPVPFSLYRKALALPVVLYRISSFLRADQLRMAVAKDVGIGAQISNEFRWMAFEFGDEYLKKSARSEHSPSCFEHNQNTDASGAIRVGDSFVSKINLDYQVSLVNHPGPSLGMLLTALTLCGANDGVNLERLEVVGDSFLKYAISVFLHCTYKELDEGKLTSLKTHLIRNSYLIKLGKKKGLHNLITAARFEGRGNWIPPCYMPVCSEQLKQGLSAEKHSSKEKQNLIHYTKQRIPGKSIADCVEALIGAYLLSCGPYGALKFMSWLGMKVFNNYIPSEPCIMLGIYPWLNYTMHKPQDISSLSIYPNYKAFQQNIGYMFKNEIYLLEAFTHPTYNPSFRTGCYQRLEFLGDALLDYIVIRYLYEDPKNHPPGAMTDIRAALVNNHFFATLAAKYNFHKYILYESCSLFQVLDKFVDKVTSEEIDVGHCSYDIEESETDDTDEIDVPKALADVFESLAGAIYIDSGMSLEEVWKVYYPMIKPGLENFCSNVPIPPVRQLFEAFPGKIKFHAPKVLPSRLVQVNVTVADFGEFEGMGTNKSVAKRAAAKRALSALQNLQQREAMRMHNN